MAHHACRRQRLHQPVAQRFHVARRDHIRAPAAELFKQSAIAVLSTLDLLALTFLGLAVFAEQIVEEGRAPPRGREVAALAYLRAALLTHRDCERTRPDPLPMAPAVVVVVNPPKTRTLRVFVHSAGLLHFLACHRNLLGQHLQNGTPTLPAISISATSTAARQPL